MKALPAALAFASLLAAGASADPAKPPAPTPTSVVAAGAPDDWTPIDPGELLVMDLAHGGRVVIQLAEPFAPVHIANIRTLARAHWFDGLAIERVQDNYVVQWGDPGGKKPLPPGVVKSAPAEYSRPAAGIPISPLPFADTYADRVGFWARSRSPRPAARPGSPTATAWSASAGTSTRTPAPAPSFMR